MSTSTSRSGELLKSIPPATLGILGLLGITYLFQLVFDPDLHHYTMNPRSIWHLNEYYRLITSCLFHGSLMHIAMNAMSTLAISSMLEKKSGTIRHIMTILWAMLLSSSLYVITSLLLHLLVGYDKLMYTHSLGFSGVIFHMSILESHLSTQRTRSVFGFITVPSYLYPWALLVVLQLFMPQLSFMGHLAGILTGTLQLYGLLDMIMVTDTYIIDYIETWKVLEGWLVSRPSFVSAATIVAAAESTATTMAGAPSTTRDAASLRRALYHGGMTVMTFLKNVIETISVVLFGRGRGNENIQLGAMQQRHQHPQQSIVADAELMFEDDYCDDDDWVGLPSQIPSSSSLSTGRRDGNDGMIV